MTLLATVHLPRLRFLLMILSLICGGASVNALPLSPGDRVLLESPYDEGLNGSYQIDLDGMISIPYILPVYIQGLEPIQAEEIIENQLLKQKYFNYGYSDITLQVQLLAPVNVFVQGEVFNPGRITINKESKDLFDDETPQKTGDGTVERNLTAALRAAGGITPNADLSEVKVIRKNKTYISDITGVFSGEPFLDLPLLEGDQIIVPKASVPLKDIKRVSQISPLGVKIYIANLSEYVRSNTALSTSNQATSFPYGSRLVHALTSGNCLGGGIIDKDKVVVHGRASRLTGAVEWKRYSVESVLKNSNKQNGETSNPLLFNNDLVVCYASAGTSLKDLGKAITEIFSPLFFFPLFK